jgi:porphobilinogen synthase
MYPNTRMRRTRAWKASRDLTAETHLSASDLIYPVFISDAKSGSEPIESLSGESRHSEESLLKHIDPLLNLGLQSVALFPCITGTLKSSDGSEAWNSQGLVPRVIRRLRQEFPDLLCIADVALDPYTSHGQDGVVDSSGRILNDETNQCLVQQSLCLVEAGAQVVAPSDMMDGRVGSIRQALEQQGHHDTLILSYAAKYASCLYGPFRQAVGSAGALGVSSKETYQMQPGNRREALREVALDLQEGADWILVKPGLWYGDVVLAITQEWGVPTFVYQVSGEYAMLQAGIASGFLDGKKSIVESLLCSKRAGASGIFSYFTPRVLRWLSEGVL